MIELLILFSSAFLAATILPAQSEIVLVSLNLSGNHNPTLLLLVATLGNVLGSVVNWIIGYYLINYKDRKWFPLKDRQLEKYSNMYKKWGKWSLLLAWVPLVGDPLTVIAGIFRTNIWLFIILVTIGKTARYIVLIILTSQI